MSEIPLLSERAKEESTYIIRVDFYDESSPPLEMTPNSIYWTLVTLEGDIINSRSKVSVTPASTVYLVLKGDDLAMDGSSETITREVRISGSYDSAYGTGLPYNDAVRFEIINIVGAPLASTSPSASPSASISASISISPSASVSASPS